MKNFRALLQVAVLALIGTASVGTAHAQAKRPITLILPWTAGGPTDVVMRMMAEIASKHLDQPIIVDNRAGASGTAGPAVMAATAKPDGLTISQIPVGIYRIPLLQKTTWDPEQDFTYIIHLTGYAFATFASMESGFKTWQDVVDFARKNPGKVTYATPGAGSSQHIAMERLARRDGIKLTQVPFKGGTEVNAAVAGNHTMLGTSGPSAKVLADAGKLRFLNVWTANRVKTLPDIPTLQELGYPYVFDSPWGLAGPKNMDPAVVARLHDAFKKALDDPAVLELLDKYEMVPNYKNSADYTKFVSDFIASEREALTQIGIARKD